MSCPLCSSEQVSSLGRRSRFGSISGYGPFVDDVGRFDRDVLSCSTCGLKYTSPPYDSADLTALYGGEGYRRFMDIIHPADSTRLIGAWREQFEGLGAIEWAKHPPGTQRRTMLDVGCGMGRNLAVFRDLGFDVLGIDLNDDELAQARRRFGVEVKNANVYDFSRCGQKFDIVLASHVIEHVDNPHAFLEALNQLTADGGRIVLETPLLNDAGRTEERYRDIYHTLFFDHFTLGLLAGMGGFRVVQSQNLLFLAPSDLTNCLFMQVVLTRSNQVRPELDVIATSRTGYDALLRDAEAWARTSIDLRYPRVKRLVRGSREILKRLPPSVQTPLRKLLKTAIG